MMHSATTRSFTYLAHSSPTGYSNGGVYMCWIPWKYWISGCKILIITRCLYFSCFFIL